MRSKEKSKNFTKAVNWKYLGLGVAIIAILVAAIQFTGTSALSQEEEKIASSLEIRYGEIEEKTSLMIENGTTAFRLVNDTHTIEYNEYSFGYFITGVDGVNQNDTHSWLYFVNGVPPLVSIDNYVLEDGDSVSLMLLSNDESMEYFE